jgi:ubiquinone/menaquinone biosynthesis C-methylase UbiE
MIDPSVAWVVGDAEQLPIDDASMDAFTIAFGIRNCTHIDKVIKVPPPRPPAPTIIQCIPFT